MPLACPYRPIIPLSSPYHRIVFFLIPFGFLLVFFWYSLGKPSRFLKETKRNPKENNTTTWLKNDDGLRPSKARAAAQDALNHETC